MDTKTVMRSALAGLALAAAGFLPASAQSSAVGWNAWIGCWQADGGPMDTALCVRRADGEPDAVEILRVEGSEILAREVVWADGARHETVRDGCTGWETGRFSQDGRRVLLQSSHTCEDGAVQDGGGIMTLASPDEWLDVRYLEVGDEPTAWVQRYRPAQMSVWQAAGMADLAPERVGRIRAARYAAAEAPDIDDVIEASAELPPEAVEAWIAEKGDPFALDAETLIALSDAGVEDRVIDVVVAVSNPDVFTMAADGAPRPVEQDRAYRDGRFRGRLGLDLYDPFYFNRLRYSPYYGYGYSPFGYGGWGYYGNGSYGYGYRPTVIVVDRKEDRGSGGRVIAGRGYRRPGSGGSGGDARRPSVNRPSGGSGASSASPSSGPSRSGSSGRKAKPRPKGGSGGGL